MTRAQIHRYILICALSGLTIGLPFSKAILSISGLVLAVNFLVEGQFNEKLKQLKQATWAQLWLGVFILHIIGLLWTTDFAYAADDIRTKLPLLLLPVVIGSTRINQREWRIILHFFISAVFLASVINWYVFVHDGMDDDLELRNLSLFTSHIRFALMIIIALILSAAQLQYTNKPARLTYLILIGWFIYYTWFSQVLSGYVSFGLILIATSIYWLGKHLRSRYKPFAAIFLAVAGIGLLVYIFWTIQPPVRQEIDRETVVWYTANGNPYTHEHENGLTENGYYIYSYLSMDEIKREWNKVSKIDFDSTDAKGDPVYGTLIRYMTSQGLRKDSADFQKLTPKDIHYVEQGIASVVYLRGGMRGRLARISMDIQKFKEGGDPNGHTALERIAYWQAGIHLISVNFWLGTGTGDIHAAFQNHYEDTSSKLLPHNRSRTHNQFMTMWIAFGVIGFLLFVLTQFYSLILFIKKKQFQSVLIWLVLTTSFMTEDTLETQTGVTLVIFFISLLCALETHQTPANKNRL